MLNPFYLSAALGLLGIAITNGQNCIWCLSRKGHPLLDAPRTDPGGRDSRTGLPPRGVNDESHEQLRVHSRCSGTRLIRRSVRYVCCSAMFPSCLSLGSTNSVPRAPALFGGFSALIN